LKSVLSTSDSSFDPGDSARAWDSCLPDLGNRVDMMCQLDFKRNQ
jgi:hypothetical protein